MMSAVETGEKRLRRVVIYKCICNVVGLHVNKNQIRKDRKSICALARGKMNSEIDKLSNELFEIRI